MRSIQSKILFVVISALLVITAIVTTIAVSVAHDIIHKDADRILNNVSQKEAAYINDMLNDIMKSAAIMEHYATSELEHSQKLGEENYLNQYTAKIRQMFDEVAINTSGISSYYLCFSPELTAATTGFYTRFEEDGKIRELTGEDFAGLSLITSEQLEYYKYAMNGDNDIWMQPHPSRFTGETVVSYLVPIYYSDSPYIEGTFVGILGFNVDFEYLLGLVNEISVYESGYALLLSEDKATVYNPPENMVFDAEYAEATTPLVNEMKLELRATYKDIQSGIRPMLTYIVIAFIAVLVLAIAYTFWVTNKIVTPLKKLTAAAGSISSGVQDVNLVVDSKDEIGILSRVLNNTYAKIREYSTYINALAYRDSLTGIKNSTAYTEAIAEVNREINLGNPSFGVIVADVNNLKLTNDKYGHDIGNELIVRAANIMSDIFKTSAVFRIGGDEFAVFLRGKDLDAHRALIEKMDEAFSREYLTVRGNSVPVSIARGVAIFNSSIDRVYTDVFSRADHAMYMNKEEMKAVRM